MKSWNEHSYNEKMRLIADALGVSHWSNSDCGCEYMLDLLDVLKARNLHGAYVRHLAALLSISIDIPEQTALLFLADLDDQYHAAARALGIDV